MHSAVPTTRLPPFRRRRVGAGVRVVLAAMGLFAAAVLGACGGGHRSPGTDGAHLGAPKSGRSAAGSSSSSGATRQGPGSTSTGPPPPPAPGPLEADGVAWQGHGDLAFVSDNRLYVLGDDGVLTLVRGPTVAGAYHAPAWSDDGQWLAFAYDVAPNQLPEGLPADDEPADDTLWVVHAGQTEAHEVAPMDVGEFAWSPAGPPVLAFEALTFDDTGESLWTAAPGEPAAPVPDLAAQPIGMAGFAWSPDATDFAVVAGRDGQPGGPGPLSELQVIPARGGAAVTWYQSTQDGIDLDGYWPDGRGLLYWLDPGNAEDLDGITLYSQASGGTPRPLATTLVSPTAVAWTPDADQPDLARVALAVGGDRVVWAGAKRVETCDPVTASCQPVVEPPGTVSLAPVWASDSDLYFVAASDTGPFGAVALANLTDGWLGLWDESARLYGATPQGPHLVSGSGAGVVDADPGASGGLLVVRDDALWLQSGEGAAIEVAGPLFSVASPVGYYGQVDWSSMFAWSRPAPS